ncbi:MAG: DUF4198 domain-containing protein [Lautropia sp.]|nr:DUF4198 domain-containing protein [Lautropia sp.]
MLIKTRHTTLLSSALLAAGILVAPTASQAHGTWLSSIHGEPTILYGHHESDTDPYLPSTIESVRAYKNGKEQPVKIVRHENKYVTLESSKPGLISYTMNNGYWHKDQDGKWHNEPKDKAANPSTLKAAVQSTKYSVNYMNNREPVRTLGFPLEIVPATNPAKLHQGDKLVVQVLYKGKPLPGVEVTNNLFGEGKTAKTDKDGRVELPVAREDLNTFAVEHEVEYKDKTKADTQALFAGLSFRAHEEHDHEH